VGQPLRWVDAPVLRYTTCDIGRGVVSTLVVFLRIVRRRCSHEIRAERARITPTKSSAESVEIFKAWTLSPGAMQNRLNPSRIGGSFFRDFHSIRDLCTENENGNEGVATRGNEARFLARSFLGDFETAYALKVLSESKLETSAVENGALVSSLPESRTWKRETKGNQNGNEGRMRGFRVERFLVVWKRNWKRVMILNS
jgi:hypothetical protein